MSKWLEIPVAAFGTQASVGDEMAALSEVLAEMAAAGSLADGIRDAPTLSVESPITLFPSDPPMVKVARLPMLASLHNMVVGNLLGCGWRPRGALRTAGEGLAAAPWGTLAVIGASDRYEPYPDLFLSQVESSLASEELLSLSYCVGDKRFSYSGFLRWHFRVVLNAWGQGDFESSASPISALRDAVHRIRCAGVDEVAQAIARHVESYRSELMFRYRTIPDEDAILAFVKAMPAAQLDSVRIAGNRAVLVVLDAIASE